MRARLAAVVLLTAGLSSPVTSAQAVGPVRTGWWNTATVSGTALPTTTGPHDLHLAAGPAGALANAAVSYHGPAYPSAVLTLHVVPNSEVGTPAVLVCPTRDDSWTPGGDQPIDAAPAYDCAGRSVVGIVGADSTGATTLTFLLDPSQQVSPGVTSLALVPAAGAAFSLDLAAPDGSSLDVQAAPQPPAPAYVPPSAADSGGSAGAPQPGRPALPTGAFTSGSGPLGPAATAPQIAPSAAPPAPVLAGPSTRGQVLPGPGRSSSSSERREAAVLLGLVLAGLGCALLESRPTPPRLLGGRARANVPPAVPTGRERGIGRFARPRAEPPRRLL